MNKIEEHSVMGTGYVAKIIHLNQAALPQGLLALHFEPGMGFGDFGKWWGDKGRRSTPHEGIDIIYLSNKSGHISSLKAGARVPALFDGILVHMVDDFHGQTLFVGHKDMKQGKNILFSIYAHVKTGLRRDAHVKIGEKIATIAQISGMTAPPAHLHLSMAWLPAGRPELFNWQSLCGPQRESLIDPTPFLRLRR